MFAERDIIFTRNEADRLPVDTVVSINGQPAYTRQTNGWVDTDGRVQPFLSPPADGTHSIVTMPKARLLTLKQWQWRLYDVTRTAGKVYGVSGVRETLQDLGLTRRTFDAGVGQRVLFNEYQDDPNRLPVGSLASRGNPLDDTYEVYERMPSGWHSVMGGNRLSGIGYMTIEQVGDEEVQQEWVNAVGTEADIPEIVEFRAQVWAVGRRAKTRHSWCGTFENVMSRLGVDSSVVTLPNGIGIGSVMPLEEGLRLPVGTLVTWIGRRTGRTYLGIRVAREGNAAGTRRIGCWGADLTPVENERQTGHYPGGNGELTVVALSGQVGGSGFRLPGTREQARAIWATLPDNIRFSCDQEAEAQFTKLDRTRFNYMGGTHRIADNDYAGIFIAPAPDQVSR